MTITAAPALTAVLKPAELLESLRARYAVKKYDPAGRIPAPTWDALEQALVLAPSSYGLQPWRFFVVDDPALRARLKDASWGQGQVVDADKLVVFAVRKDLGAADVDRYLSRIAEERKVPLASLTDFRGMLLKAVSRPPADVAAWAARQAYIALGVFLTAAAALGVDATPMEGIEPAKYDALLGLPEKGYTALFIAAAGRRAPDDAYGEQPKVRFAREDVVVHL